MSRPYLGAPVPQVGFDHIRVGSDLFPNMKSVSEGLPTKNTLAYALNDL